MAEIQAAWVQPQAEWAQRRLLVVRLIGQNELTVAQIMRAADGSRQTVFTYRDKVVAEGVAGLLTRAWQGARVPAVRGAVANRLCPTLSHIEDHLAAAARPWCQPAQVAGLIHRWLADQANAGAPA